MASLARLTVSRLLLARPATRALGPATTATRAMSQSWQQYGIPGSNLPFNIHNKYKLSVYFILFFGSAFNLPFIVVALQLMKS
ncbi:cytochrome c oxidase subunit 7C, mitochondrial-like [Littorina saxatilis]|uniref:cytochrome c oxidase subunit 7C, mitochondrial-like n=1 Tax=Littorina saxatilis TaxID=31220 RepID=UPI0038B6550F